MESTTSLRDLDERNYTNMTIKNTPNNEVNESLVIIYIIIGKNIFTLNRNIYLRISAPVLVWVQHDRPV